MAEDQAFSRLIFVFAAAIAIIVGLILFSVFF